MWDDYKSAILYFCQEEHQWLQANPDLVKSIGYTRPNRQASPLWLRVLPYKTKYILLATLFDIDFPGSDYKAVTKFLVNEAKFTEIPQ